MFAFVIDFKFFKNRSKSCFIFWLVLLKKSSISLIYSTFLLLLLVKAKIFVIGIFNKKSVKPIDKVKRLADLIVSWTILKSSFLTFQFLNWSEK